MRFKDIIGQESAVRSLRDMVDEDRIPHAILLSGPSGIGKMNLARAFVQYVNCEHRQGGDSCGECASCRRIMKMSDPDVHYIYPFVKREKKGATISEDLLDKWVVMFERHPYMPMPQWLDLIDAGNSQPMIYVNDSDRISETASMSSYADRFKIFIIWLPEKMHIAAANKLLKVLEEPFEDTIFIGVSDDSASILPTILSRFRRIEMRRPTTEQVERALAAKGLPEATAREFARLAQGDLQRASELAENAGEQREFGEAFRNIMRAAYAMQAAKLKSFADLTAEGGREKTIRLLNYFARMIRENFIYNLRMPALNVMTADETEFSNRFAPFIHHNNVELMLDDIDKAVRDISRNGNVKLTLFDYLLQLMVRIKMKR